MPEVPLHDWQLKMPYTILRFYTTAEERRTRKRKERDQEDELTSKATRKRAPNPARQGKVIKSPQSHRHLPKFWESDPGCMA
jgi:hypothetical protein